MTHHNLANSLPVSPGSSPVFPVTLPFNDEDGRALPQPSGYQTGTFLRDWAVSTQWNEGLLSDKRQKEISGAIHMVRSSRWEVSGILPWCKNIRLKDTPKNLNLTHNSHSA